MFCKQTSVIFLALTLGLFSFGQIEQTHASDATGSGTPQVNINTASATELMLLPGVGPKTAQAIIDYRKRRPFTKCAQIIRIKGIGRKTYRKLKPYIILSGETTAKGKIRVK